jgi:hypothetical protein
MALVLPIAYFIINFCIKSNSFWVKDPLLAPRTLATVDFTYALAHSYLQHSITVTPREGTLSSSVYGGCAKVRCGVGGGCATSSGRGDLRQ